ncbi:MAG: prolipoprotein diacylglyceryl transferase [Spirochaetota bacterium]|nr:prolipoprotein diacylglyceryl transferase [Spirochaetota bacterium]
MFPILFKYKFITIGGYGVMLGLGFYMAFLLLERELKLRGIDPDLAYKLLLVAIPCGIIGAKIAHILDHFDSFLVDPWGMVFSGSGLAAYGGYILSLAAGIIVIKKNKHNVLTIFDAISPSLALGYCFGRLGCHVAGDGCYGLDTVSFWGTAYPNGIVPTTMTVLPTPLFESFFSFLLVGLLLAFRKRGLPTGRLFSIYLMLSASARFMVEFIRRCPETFLNLTQAQLTAILFILIGIACWMYSNKLEVET